MAINWAVIETEDGSERHVVPTINIDGENVVSNAHILSRDCPCAPNNIQDVEPAYGTFYGPIWNHNDPDHPGADVG